MEKKDEEDDGVVKCVKVLKLMMVKGLRWGLLDEEDEDEDVCEGSVLDVMWLMIVN